MGCTLYIDCFSGVSGDMMAAALLDLGLELDSIERELKKIGLEDYRITAEDTRVHSLAAKKFEVHYGEQPLRKYSDIKELIGSSGLKDNIKADCLEIFNILAQAEAAAHGCPLEEIHFHEIGAVDSIIDIAFAAVAFNQLKPDGIYCSKIPLGSGFTDCMHGRIPVPAPATMEILKGIPVHSGNFDFEVTTPTGAAIIKKFACSFGDMPFGEIEAVGMGAGSRKSEDIPNILRVIKLNRTDDRKSQYLKMLCANIDDLTPEIMGYVVQKLIEEGANDAWVENILMKKGRPAFKLCTVCSPRLEEKIASVIFSQTTTLGIRIQDFRRAVMDREIKEIDLGYGKAEIKLGMAGKKIVSAQPEYSSCLKLAERTGKPLKTVFDDVKRAYIENNSL